MYSATTALVSLLATVDSAWSAVARAAADEPKAADTVFPFTVFVSNEAQSRPSPYTFDVSSIQAVAPMANAVVYGPLVFDSSYAIVSNNYNDASENYAHLMSLKELNSDIQILFCVGGTQFPSHSWSAMAASSDARAAFITSVLSMNTLYGFDGVEIHWDYPGSPSRTLWQGSMNSGFTAITDNGGSSDDLSNLVVLLTEMRANVGSDFIISLSVGRDSSHWADALSDIDGLVDMYYIKAFDYNVAADPNGGSDVTAPAQPIRQSDNFDSVDATLKGYANAHMTLSKANLVVSAHGQSYHLPDAVRDGWGQFGLTATVTGLCGGPFAGTHGAYPSAATGVCGELTMGEILQGMADTESSAPAPIHDETTGSDIAFLPKTQTWISYTGPTAVQAIVEVAQTYRVGGLAVHTLDMDWFEGAPSFNLTQELCYSYFGSSDTRCVLAQTTRAPSTDDCSSGIEGIFCLTDGTGFIFCPQGSSEYCPSGTVCKPLGDTTVMCDWPDNYWSSWSNSNEVKKVASETVANE
eukprot:m.173137 g.173137  ORF g.173137 m.173137 type:complete len:524 (-) comp13649_c0_seq1:103-1674(-)